jgi:hypothetical protein
MMTLYAMIVKEIIISIYISLQYPPLKKLGLDEFVMDYEKDPYNINFHTGRLNISKSLINWLIDWLITVLRPAQVFFTYVEMK